MLFCGLFSPQELPCGHFMHSSCFAAYTRYNYTCPICSKSIGDMSVYFQMLDSLLSSERLPPEYAGKMQQVGDQRWITPNSWYCTACCILLHPV